jgi:hypothetical protein
MALILKTVPASRGTALDRRSLPRLRAAAAGLHGLVRGVPVRGHAGQPGALLGGLVQMMSLPLLSLGFMIAAQSALAGRPGDPRQFIEPLQGDAARRRPCSSCARCTACWPWWCCCWPTRCPDHAWGRLQELIAKGGEAAQAEIDALLAEPRVTVGTVLALVLGAALSVPFWHAQSTGVSLAIASASHLLPWRPKLTWARASAPLPSSVSDHAFAELGVEHRLPHAQALWPGTAAGPGGCSAAGARLHAPCADDARQPRCRAARPAGTRAHSPSRSPAGAA